MTRVKSSSIVKRARACLFAEPHHRQVVFGVAARVYAVSKNKYPVIGTFGSKSLDVTERVIAFRDCTYEPQDIISKTRCS